MKPIRVVIIDDSALIRGLLTELLRAESDIDVVGVACDAFEAREVIKRHNPDVVTLDIEMPKMDGLDFLEKVMRLRPMPVIMVSSLTQKGADATIRALELGAVDCVAKVGSESLGDIDALRAELVAKVRAAAGAKVDRNISSDEAKPTLPFNPTRATRDLIAIGASTGGVEALREVLIRFPANCPPIVVTQHMPAYYTASFARRLDSLCTITVQEAQHNDRLVPGTAYIAPGGNHMEILYRNGAYTAQLSETPPVSGHRPSVDVLFHSVAVAAADKAVGVILTGMGSDGAAGLKAMRDAGAPTIGQSEETCVIYGMPRVARERGAVVEEIPLSQIASRALSVCCTANRMELRA